MSQEKKTYTPLFSGRAALCKGYLSPNLKINDAGGAMVEMALVILAFGVLIATIGVPTVTTIQSTEIDTHLAHIGLPTKFPKVTKYLSDGSQAIPSMAILSDITGWYIPVLDSIHRDIESKTNNNRFCFFLFKGSRGPTCSNPPASSQELMIADLSRPTWCSGFSTMSAINTQRALDAQALVVSALGNRCVGRWIVGINRDDGKLSPLIPTGALLGTLGSTGFQLAAPGYDTNGINTGFSSATMF